MQTWHDGLQSEPPVFVALPRRPGMRMKRATRTASTPSLSAFAGEAELLPDRAPIEIPADCEA